MDDKLQAKLIKKFPKILKAKKKSMSPFSAYGVECDDGWYDMIFNLCTELQTLCDSNGTQVTALQIKEKFATLRVYISIDDGATDAQYKAQYKAINEIMNKYDDISRKTCEVTGNVGCLYKRGFWVKTLCVESAILLGYKLAK
jgi:hypothetical protein